MKRIYRILLVVCSMGISLSSCNEWLNVRPSDEIKEEALFETGNGFRTALNGIYREMASFNLYGSNLSWGLLDAWAQVYDMDAVGTAAGAQAMQKLAIQEYKNSELTPTTDAMWDAAWNVIANCNNLIQQIENTDASLFYSGEKEKNMILGEALALRAYVHFDLLRVYAPSPVMSPGERIYIPYVETYPSYERVNQTVDYCLKHVVADLKKAQGILLSVDEDYGFSFTRCFNSTGYSKENLFMGYRGYRMNYYAVTAELARVYLYAQQPGEAYEEALKVINVEKEKSYFKAVTSTYSGPRNIESGNIKIADNVIFGLYCTDLTDWDHNINHASENASDKYSEYYLCWAPSMVNEFFGNEKSQDWRFRYQLEEKYKGYRTLKYYKQGARSEYATVNNDLLPMIRMSEVYYIAAEAIYDQDPDLAKKYLSYVKAGRGISNVDYSSVSTKEHFIDMIVSDARREFFGEGQTFFMYKRLKKNLKGMDGDYYPIDITATEQNMVLPQPDSESNI